jgi:hypothetical protein
MTNTHVGNNKEVTTSITLTGTHAANYTLTQPGGITVDITCSHPSFSNWVIVTTATCVATGLERRTCVIPGCDHEETETIAIDPSAHLENSWNWLTAYDDTTGKVGCTRSGCQGGGFALIGDTGPAGGIIFYHVEAGFPLQGYPTGTTGTTVFYLEAWTANEFRLSSSFQTMDWFHQTSLNANVQQTHNPSNPTQWIGYGFRNTKRILAAIDATLAVRGSAAAHVCDIADHGGFNDWFLPSVDELRMLALVRGVRGGILNLPENNYWSSSQPNNDTHAVTVGFPSDLGAAPVFNQFLIYLTGQAVRAVRAF